MHRILAAREPLAQRIGHQLLLHASLQIMPGGGVGLTVDGRTAVLHGTACAPLRMGHSHAILNPSHPVEFMNIDISAVKGKYDASSEGRHRHTGVEEIYHVLNGEGEAVVTGETAPIRKGDAVPVLLGKPHAFRPTGSQGLELMIVGVAARKNAVD